MRDQGFHFLPSISDGLRHTTGDDREKAPVSGRKNLSVVFCAERGLIPRRPIRNTYSDFMPLTDRKRCRGNRCFKGALLVA